MKTLLAAVLLFTVTSLRAQVPQFLNYQGRVAIAGVNYDGSGRFKFALVAEVPGRPLQTLWSNDGTGVEGSEPLTAVGLTVTKGLYSVLLGDTTLTNMTPVPASVFTSPGVSLRVWFSDGTHGSQLLTPDQRIAAVGYAMMAADVKDGAITGAKLAPGAVGGAQLAPGAVQATHLAAGAAAANLQAGGQSGVASGGLVLSATPNPALTNAGYVKVGTTTMSDGWQQGTNLGAPGARRNHTAVWTGTEMIVWGGTTGLYNLPNRRYNPATNVWRTIETSDSPNGQELHGAVWTGTQMIIWGGTNGLVNSNFGRRYDPVLDSWSGVTSVGAPSARYTHTAVWTGTEMIVWGGFGAGGVLGDGARYVAASDTWIPMSSAGAPSARNGHSAVWTGTEMIIWGGRAPGGGFGFYYGDGARYSPATNTWTPIPASASSPSGRSNHTAVWTGSEMIIWGGEDAVTYHGNGKRYHPATNTWDVVSNSGVTRSRHTAVWTGSEMIIWGGENGVSNLNSGQRYQPATDTWLGLTTTGAPSARSSHTTVWTGGELIVFGGYNGSYLGDTALCTPGRTMYLYQRP